MGLDERLVLGRVVEGGRIQQKEGLEEIAEVTLQRCTTNERGLHLLDISHMAFSGAFLAEFGRAMCHNTELREVYLDNCHLSDEGVRLLAQGLSRNAHHSIRALSLEDNHIHCRGATFLAKLLSARRGGPRWAGSVAEPPRVAGGAAQPSSGRSSAGGLRYLSLKGNCIAAVGAKAFAEALLQNTESLETLDLEANRVCDWSAGWFAMVLRNHRTLRCLNLRGNPIGRGGVEELRGACSNVQARLVVVSHSADTSFQQEDDAEAVEAQRGAAVYVTEAPAEEEFWRLPGGAQGHSRPSSASSRPSSASSRPGSASDRRPLGSLVSSVRRSSRASSATSDRGYEVSTHLGAPKWCLFEAGGSGPSSGRPPSAAWGGPRPSRARPGSRRVGAACAGARLSRGRRVPAPMPPTYPAGYHAPCTSSGAGAPQAHGEPADDDPDDGPMEDAEPRPGPAAGAPAAEASPSRWRRKPRAGLDPHPWEVAWSPRGGARCQPQPQGGGAAAVRGILKRSSSVPGSSVLEEPPGSSAADSLLSDRSAGQPMAESEENQPLGAYDWLI